MAFLGHISMKSETNALKTAIIQTADPVKEKIAFCYYRLAKGISGILSYAKEGIRLWFRTKRPAYRQLCLKLAVWTDKRIRLPKSGSGGAYKSASIHKTAALYLLKIWQIGALGDYIHFWITVCGNSRPLIFHGRFFMEIIYPATTKTPDPCQVKKFHISPGTMKPDTFYAPLWLCSGPQYSRSSSYLDWHAQQDSAHPAGAFPG